MAEKEETIEIPMTYEEYREIARRAFMKRRIQGASREEKLEYLNSKESEEVIESCYSGDVYDYEHYPERRGGLFDEREINSKAGSTLEMLYD